MFIVAACKTSPNKVSDKESYIAPILSISDTIINFGDIQYGEIVKANIRLKNIGGSLLEITDIDYTCNCLTIDLPNYNLEMNDSTWLSVTFNSRGFNGKQLKTITITDNTPKKKYIILTSNIISN